MRKAILLIYVDEKVRIKLNDKTELKGKLKFTPDFNEKFGYKKPGWFSIGSKKFRSDSVKTLEVLL